LGRRTGKVTKKKKKGGSNYKRPKEEGKREITQTKERLGQGQLERPGKKSFHSVRKNGQRKLTSTGTAGRDFVNRGVLLTNTTGLLDVNHPIKGSDRKRRPVYQKEKRALSGKKQQSTV